MREDHTVMAQQMIGMYLIPPHQLEAVDIARAQFQIAVIVLRSYNHQHRLIDLQRVQSLLKLLGLRFLQIERTDDYQFAIRKLRRQRRPQSTQQFLPWERVVVAARNGAMHRAAMSPKGRPD